MEEIYLLLEVVLNNNDYWLLLPTSGNNIWHYILSDDTVASMGKEKGNVSDSEAFARAIDALTYQSPVTRAATTTGRRLRVVHSIYT